MKNVAKSIAVAVLLVSSVCGCAMTSGVDHGEAYLDELRKSAASGNEISSHGEVASALNISSTRAQAIIVGPGSRANLTGRLNGMTLGYMCTETQCTCSGDDDCNDMFTDVCRDPSTNGVCIETGGSVTCSCNF